ALPALKQAFADTSLTRVCRGAAAIAMMRLGDRSGEELLWEVVRKGTAAEMNGLVSRMGVTEDAAFLPMAAEALDRADAWQGVTHAVAACGGAQAIPALTKALNHPDKGVRYGAKVMLRKLGAPNAPPEE
ncbi:MAG: hypothetical protein NTV86_22465, partial [Planctomycetota bacterium]|nr:hypothetical protein [Planctomycetota bacterium]